MKDKDSAHPKPVTAGREAREGFAKDAKVKPKLVSSFLYFLSRPSRPAVRIDSTCVVTMKEQCRPSMR